MRSFRILCCAAALAAFLVPSAHADEWNKLTYLTFSGPVQVPGATLPAGTYMFKLADSMSNRHIVQVFDKDGKKLFATVLAISDQRLQPAGQNIVLFGERPSGAPQAIKAWWYPGDTIGDEFVYPKTQAMEIARDTHQPVLATEDEAGADRDHMKNEKVGRVDENGTMTNDERPAQQSEARQATPPPQTTASAEPSTTGQSATGTAATTTSGNRSAARQTTTPRATGTSGQTNTAGQTTAADQTARKTGQTARNHRQLPQTASNLPLVELLGGLAFAGAMAARQLRKRLADAR